MATGFSFGKSVFLTEEDHSISRKTFGDNWTTFALDDAEDADIMERLTVLKGVPPAVKETLIELGEMQ